MLFNSFWAFIKYYIVDNLLDQNNLMEIRTDALKLLVILRRHVPRAAATVGVWLWLEAFAFVGSSRERKVQVPESFDRFCCVKICRDESSKRKLF